MTREYDSKGNAMPVDKFSVSLPEELVADVDDIAAAEGLSRSAVIREATADYVTARKSAEYAAARRARIDRAIAGFRGMAEGWSQDERTGLDYLREIRGELEMDSTEDRVDDLT